MQTKLGAYLQARREARRMSRQEVAAKAGLSYATVYGVEGWQSPRLETLDALCAVLGANRDVALTLIREDLDAERQRLSPQRAHSLAILGDSR